MEGEGDGGYDPESTKGAAPTGFAQEGHRGEHGADDAVEIAAKGPKRASVKTVVAGKGATKEVGTAAGAAVYGEGGGRSEGHEVETGRGLDGTDGGRK